MLPTPETSVWSSSARLTALSRASAGARPRPRRRPGRAGRARCGRSARGMPSRRRASASGQAAEGALVDEPQLGSVVGEVEPGVQVLLVAARRPARRAAGRSCPRWTSRPASPSAAGRARGTCRAARPPRRRAGEPGGEVAGPARWRRATRAPRTSTPRDRAADDVVVRGRGGRPRPRGAQASAASAGLGARGRRRPWARGRPRRAGSSAVQALLGGLLLGLLLAAARCRRRGPRRRRPTRAAKVFSWSGPVLGDAVLGDAEAVAAAVSSCRLVFQSRPAPRVADCAISGSKRWCTNVAGRRRCPPTGRPRR